MSYCEALEENLSYSVKEGGTEDSKVNIRFTKEFVGGCIQFACGGPCGNSRDRGDSSGTSLSGRNSSHSEEVLLATVVGQKSFKRMAILSQWVLAFLEKWEAVHLYVPLATVKEPYDTIHCTTLTAVACPITHETVERTQTYPL